MSDDTRLDRRTVLKALGSTAAVGTGFTAGTGGAAAQATRAIGNESALREAFEHHGDDLRETLVAEGFVPADFAFADLAFDLDPAVSGLDPGDADRLAGVTAVAGDGTITALGMVSASSDTHDLALYVQPGRGKAYARATPKDGGDTLKVSGDGVTPEGCTYTSCNEDGTCDSYQCFINRDHYSCDSSCRNCDVYKSDCGCCDCNACPCCDGCGNDC